MVRTVKIRYGLDSSENEAELDFSDDATEEEIDRVVSDFVRERLWWGWSEDEKENEDGK